MALLSAACATDAQPTDTSAVPPRPVWTEAETGFAAPTAPMATAPAETLFQPEVSPTFLASPIDPDDPDSAPFLQSSSGNAIETERGIFCLYGYLLYHAEPGSTELRPFCGLPDCRHDAKGCEAWFSRHQSLGIFSGLGYCDGMLWLVEPDPEDPTVNTLLRVDPATRRREAVGETPLPEYDRQPEWFNREYYFHKDKLFELVKAGRNADLNNPQTHLYAVDLRTGEVAEPFTALFEQSFAGQYVQPLGLTAFGDQLYSQVTFWHEEIVDGWPVVAMAPYVVRLDPQTGDWEKCILQNEIGGAWYTDQNTLYAATAGGVFQEYGLASGALWGKDAGLDVYCRAYDEKYIFGLKLVGSQYTLYVFDRSYRLLATLLLPEDCQYSFCAQNTVFVQGGDFLNPPDWTIDYRIDLSSVKDGELTLEALPWKAPPQEG